ncbi:hypothetical protein QBC43DRAFT_125762 [Cladorrhinum sp. PSN259]|nr:hypothetical protein QBC43DRAFT_125762 [Cladorrhinum sp. PSN259]
MYSIDNTLTAIEIHRDQTNIPSYSSRSWKFALEEYKPGIAKVDFDREVAVLKRLSAHPHDHLIKLLFTLEIQDQDSQSLPPQPSELFLVFPLPNGNINKLWGDTANLPPKRVTKSDEARQFALWVARQCRGITEALSMLHNSRPAGQQPEEPAGPLENKEQWYVIHANITPRSLY